MYMLHHPSPLAKTAVFREAARLPRFHGVPLSREHDMILGRAMPDAFEREELDTFFGAVLPIFSPSLISLYQGISDHLSNLEPAAVLRDLLPGRSQMIVQSPARQGSMPDLVKLLKMSVAKYVAGTIREAHNNLEEEQRRSDTEMRVIHAL